MCRAPDMRENTGIPHKTLTRERRVWESASQVAWWVKNLPAMQETQEIWVQFLGQEDPLEEGTATHYSILAWRIP